MCEADDRSKSRAKSAEAFRVDGCTPHGQEILDAIYRQARTESPRPLELVLEFFRALVASGDIEEVRAEIAIADLFPHRNEKQPADSPARLDGQSAMNSLDAPRACTKSRPIIEVIRGDPDLIATQAEAALVKAGLPIFQRDGRLVQPVHCTVPAADRRTTIVAGLGDVSQPTMIGLLGQSADFRRYNRHEKRLVECGPPGLIAQIILRRPHWEEVPSVAGVITTPTLRPDGSILRVPGYDRATRLFLIQNRHLRLPPMPERSSRADALTAIELLKDLLGEFPFVAPVDLAVALSAVISPAVRGALETVPLHAFTAPAAGAGKSFLADLVSNICTGRDCPAVNTGWDRAEMEKRITGLLLKGSPLICLDNVTVDLGGDLLCQAVDRPSLESRLFQTMTMEEVENRATIYANGSALRLRGDMSRRTVIGALDPKLERPELREFSGNPVQAVLSNRGEYVAACLTIPRAYLAAGTPNKLPPLASFRTWSDLVRSALVWLDCPDPVASMEAVRADDPQLSALRQVLAAWVSCFGSDAMTSAAVVEVANSTRNSELRTALATVASLRGGGEIDAGKLGRWLRSSRDRIADDKIRHRWPCPRECLKVGRLHRS